MMNSEMVALLVPEGTREATMLVRRASGQFSLRRIDARMAVAARTVAAWSTDRSSAQPARRSALPV